MPDQALYASEIPSQIPEVSIPPTQDELPCDDEIPMETHRHKLQMDLQLVRWQGVFKAVETTWLRWSTLDGILRPTDQELASAAKQEVNAERQRADRLAERLRSLGADPEDL